MYQIDELPTQTFADVLSTATVKAWLKVETDADDDLISGLRDAAVAHCEETTNRHFRTTAYLIKAPSWQAIQRLPFGPITTLSTLNYYVEGNATAQTLPSTEYTASLNGDVLYITYRDAPPVVDPYRYDAVLLGGTGGTVASSVPQHVKTAALMLVGHWYENRQAVHIGSKIYTTPMAVDALLAPYRIA